MWARERRESGGRVGEKTNKVERAKQGRNVNKNRMRVSLHRERERESINKHIVINIGVYVSVDRSIVKRK